jgi:hypothetical protein
VPAPEGLRGRLLERLAAERQAWNRRWLLRGAGVAAAAAAAVFLTVGLWLHFRPQPEPLNLPQVLQARLVEQNASPDLVEEGFRDRYGMRGVAAPREFDGLPLNYALLVHYGPGFCQDHRVPALVFVQGSDHAIIYVVSGRQFDLKAAANLQPENSGGIKVEVRMHPDNPNVAYVIIYTGDSLQRFLRNEGGGQIG